MSKRQEGWYWVQGMDGCPWECSYWTGDGWDDNEAHEYEPTTVGPRIPSPEEGWQCVPIEPTPAMRQAAIDASENDGNAWLSMLRRAPKP